ncbi:C40 family peptidase [Clostridium sp. BJN0001]|uniref:C40 family peptidase n=1 Tax=Clostridium sp. BJN0001 TaxID=2930219 RepID=UPI002468126A|nr:C40 family peptidase [Clostridium sp. BJN0001]
MYSNMKKIILKSAMSIAVAGTVFIAPLSASADTTLTTSSTSTVKTANLVSVKTIKAPIKKAASDSSLLPESMLSRGESGKTSSIINTAYSLLGKPYVYGAVGPNAFDCSGFTKYVYGKSGISLNRTTYQQVTQGSIVSKSNLEPGDLVFFNTMGSISHVGIYVGGGDFIHAPRTGKPVMVSSLNSSYYSRVYATARRII